jgi:hypothetical protein
VESKIQNIVYILDVAGVYYFCFSATTPVALKPSKVLERSFKILSNDSNVGFDLNSRWWNHFRCREVNFSPVLGSINSTANDDIYDNLRL